MIDTFPEKDIPTRAIVVEAPGAPFILQNVILDEVRPHELLIQMMYTGICHTVRDPTTPANANQGYAVC
jgi:Zn-dependent alcohol dehydrogenase